MNLTDNEWAAIVAVIRDAEKQHGEDAIGVFLKTSGHTLLSGKAIVQLVHKLDGKPEEQTEGLPSQLQSEVREAALAVRNRARGLAYGLHREEDRGSSAYQHRLSP